MDYTIDDFAQMIDHVKVNPDITKEELKQLCDEAIRYNFKIVAINSAHTKFCKELLKNSTVGVGAAISFPYGQTTIEAKIEETKLAILDGADEIDYSINLTEVKDGNYDYIEKEMTSIVQLCNESNLISKVILETGSLTQDQIIKICEIAKKVKPSFVKTSTGTTSKGATFEDVKLMKQVVGHEVGVKASGGVRNAQTLIEMIKAGASRFGSSSGINIINEFSDILSNSGADVIEI